jgi:predicted ATPase
MATESSRRFAELLRAHRRAAGLTQEELAERARLSVRALRNLESGISQAPRRDTLTLLSSALALAPDDHEAFLAAARHARALPVSPASAPSSASLDAATATATAGPPALDAAPATPHNLPVPLTALLGREHEEAAAMHLLRREDVRLLTLTGAPGIGKTRLALQVAENLRDEAPGRPFPDGVELVELAPIMDAALVLPTIMRVLGVREADGEPGAALTALVEYLRPRAMLLLLDNFEQVVAAAPQVANLLVECPRVKMLVTSRIPLRLRGEHRLAIPPLALPDLAALPAAAEELMQYASVALFVQRAREVKPNFALPAAQAPAVAAICHRLDGLPLAIELAAAWVRLLSPVALRRRLERRLPLLMGSARDLPERQQTLRTAIDWSHDLLGPTEQMLFRRLAVFVGGWALEAAEAVCGEAGPESRPESRQGEEVLPALATLVDTNLVDQQEEAASGENRFRLLELVREYALERLAASGEAEAVAERHARYYMSLARQAGMAMGGPETSAWVSRLGRDSENLRTALEWAKEHDIAAGLFMAGNIWDYWHTQGQVNEGRKWLRTFWELDAAAGMIAPPLVRVTALNAEGILARKQGDHALAAERFAEVLPLARMVGHERILANALMNLAMEWQEQGDFARAQALYQECLVLRQEINQRLEEAATAQREGRLAPEEMRVLWRELGTMAAVEDAGTPQDALANLVKWNHLATAATFGNCGRLAMITGDFARAGELLEHTRTLFGQLGRTLNVMQAHMALAEVAVREGDFARARVLLELALPVLRAEGVPDDVAEALNCLGRVAWGQGDAAQACALYRESLALQEEVGDRQQLVEVLDSFGIVLASDRRLEAATRLLGTAEALREIIKAPRYPVDQPCIERVVRELRGALGATAFDAAWAAGRATPIEQVIAELGCA